MSQENSNNLYTGMTVNERLVVSGFIDSFDKALAKKDPDLMIKILMKIDLTKAQAEQTVDSILK